MVVNLCTRDSDMLQQISENQTQIHVELSVTSVKLIVRLLFTNIRCINDFDQDYSEVAEHIRYQNDISMW